MATPGTARSSSTSAAAGQRRLVPVVLHVLELRGHDPGLDVLLRRDERHDVGVSRIHPRLQPWAFGFQHRAQLGDELHLGPAVREGPSGVSGRSPAGACRASDDAERLAADRVRAGQPLALAVESVARPRHRPGSSELRAWLRSGQRRDRQPDQWFNPRRSSCSPPARSATPGAATSPARTCARWTWRSPRTAVGALGERPPRIPRRSVQPLQPRELRHPRPDRVRRPGRRRGAAGHVRPHPNTVTSARQMQVSVRVVF